MKLYKKVLYVDNLTLSRCDGLVTILMCSGLAIISTYPLIEPKYTRYKNSKSPDVLAGKY